MIKVSVRDFLKTGELGPVRLGMSREQVQELLGEPDDTGGNSRRHRVPTIWKYGDLELHFEQGGNRLTLIHADDFDVLSGGEVLEIDAWIAHKGISLDQVEKELELAHIPYCRKDSLYGPDTIVLSIGANVQMTFTCDPARRDSHASLVSLSCIAQDT